MGKVGRASCRADVSGGCWCFTAEALAVFASPLSARAQVILLLLRLPSTLYLLGYLGHQFPSTTPSDSHFRSQTPLGGRWALGLSCSLED